MLVRVPHVLGLNMKRYVLAVCWADWWCFLGLSPPSCWVRSEWVSRRMVF